MSTKKGTDAVLYYGAAGSRATNLLENVRDVTLNLDKSEVDVTTRAGSGWKQTIGGLKDASIEFDMIWDDEDAGFTALQAAFFNDTAVALLCLDQINGKGLDADFAITKFSRSEALDDALKVSVTAKPTRSSRAPSWKE